MKALGSLLFLIAVGGSLATVRPAQAEEQCHEINSTGKGHCVPLAPGCLFSTEGQINS